MCHNRIHIGKPEHTSCERSYLNGDVTYPYSSFTLTGCIECSNLDMSILSLIESAHVLEGNGKSAVCRDGAEGELI